MKLLYAVYSMRTPSTDECPNAGHIFHFLRETPKRKNGKLYSFSSCDQTSYKMTTYEKRSLFRLKVCHGRESMVAGTGVFGTNIFKVDRKWG